MSKNIFRAFILMILNMGHLFLIFYSHYIYNIKLHGSWYSDPLHMLAFACFAYGVIISIMYCFNKAE